MSSAKTRLPRAPAPMMTTSFIPALLCFWLTRLRFFEGPEGLCAANVPVGQNAEKRASNRRSELPRDVPIEVKWQRPECSSLRGSFGIAPEQRKEITGEA